MTVDTIIWVQLYYYFLSPNYFSWYLLVNPINWGKEFWRGQKNRKKESSTWFLPLLFSSFSPWIFGCPFASLNIKTCIDFVVCCNFPNSQQWFDVTSLVWFMWLRELYYALSQNVFFTWIFLLHTLTNYFLHYFVRFIPTSHLWVRPHHSIRPSLWFYFGNRRSWVITIYTLLMI